MAVEAGGIGARLRAGREKLNLTVLQAAEKMHVDARILESLEAEDFEALGAPVYARGHLRHYAELVGESPTELSEMYSESTRAAPQRPDLTRIAKAPPSSNSTRLVAPALVVIAVFAVAGAVWWVLSLSTKKAQTTDTVARQTAPAVAGAPAPVGGAPVGSAPVASATTGGVSNSAAAAAAPAAGGGAARPPAAAAPAAAPTRNLAASSPAAATPVRPSATPTPRVGPPGIHFAQAAAAAAAPAPTPPRAAAAPTSASDASSGTASRTGHEAQVTLHYSADSWTEIYDASGERLFYDVAPANSVRTVTGKAPLKVVLANAAGVVVEINGRNPSLTKMLHPDGSAQFLVSRAGRVGRVKVSADGG